MGNDYNKAILELLSYCTKIGATILIVDYSTKTGVIEQKDGTPTSIIFRNGKWV